MEDQLSLSSSDVLHQPVLVEQVLNQFFTLPSDLLDGGICVDATLGYGGHASALLKAFPGLRLIGIDQDPVARSFAKDRLSCFGNRVKVLASNFADFVPTEPIVAVLADLGVSSPQLDVAKRGFSFRLDGPLDMRMDTSVGLTAEELIRELDEATLADVIYKYGEERFSRRIARKIKQDLKENGKYSGTKALAFAIAGCYPAKQRYRRIHPATRTFQALRIVVNDELKVLNNFLKESPGWLQPGGLLGVISFHSLEDRQVKRAFLEDIRLNRLTKKPLVPDESELRINVRSRSAKLRFATRKK